jgi:uncharacterized protein with NRDE domain
MQDPAERATFLRVAVAGGGKHYIHELTNAVFAGTSILDGSSEYSEFMIAVYNAMEERVRKERAKFEEQVALNTNAPQRQIRDSTATLLADYTEMKEGKRPEKITKEFLKCSITLK